MNSFEKAILNYFKYEKFNKLQQVRIGIAGAGGLGSNCAVNLVRTGVKNIKIYDFDNIDYSNLNRQFYFENQVGEVKVYALKKNLLKINSNLNIEAINEKLDKNNIESAFNDCDIVVEAFDNAKCKVMLVEAYLNSSKFLVSASGIAGFGGSDKIVVKKLKEKFLSYW